MMRRVRATVYGRVQGVNFRSHTARLARALGLTGWVRNREDGAVELEGEGAVPLVEEFLGSLRIGPPAARVDRVEILEIDPVSDSEEFSIRR